MGSADRRFRPTQAWVKSEHSELTQATTLQVRSKVVSIRSLFLMKILNGNFELNTRIMFIEIILSKGFERDISNDIVISEIYIFRYLS